MRKQKGFSLIELLIVRAIILIIAAIAIPEPARPACRPMRPLRQNPFEASIAPKSSYNVAYSNVGFSTSLFAVAASPCTPSSSTGCFIDTVLANGSKAGYSLRCRSVPFLLQVA